MLVTVAWPGARYHGSYASAVAVIAAAWRAGHRVTVADHHALTRWIVTPTGTTGPENPDLFADPGAPGWVARIAAQAAAIDHPTTNTNTERTMP